MGPKVLHGEKSNVPYGLCFLISLHLVKNEIQPEGKEPAGYWLVLLSVCACTWTNITSSSCRGDNFFCGFIFKDPSKMLRTAR